MCTRFFFKQRDQFLGRRIDFFPAPGVPSNIIVPLEQIIKSSSRPRSCVACWANSPPRAPSRFQTGCRPRAMPRWRPCRGRKWPRLCSAFRQIACNKLHVLIPRKGVCADYIIYARNDNYSARRDRREGKNESECGSNARTPILYAVTTYLLRILLILLRFLLASTSAGSGCDQPQIPRLQTYRSGLRSGRYGPERVKSGGSGFFNCRGSVSNNGSLGLERYLGQS